MQFERNRMYRVKAVAEALDVSTATIYRAIEAGELTVVKIGTGKGTIRVPGQSAIAFLNACTNHADDEHSEEVA